IPGAAVDLVVAAAAVHLVGPRPAADQVVAETAEDHVVAGTAPDDVASRRPVQHVVAFATDEHRLPSVAARIFDFLALLGGTPAPASPRPATIPLIRLLTCQGSYLSAADELLVDELVGAVAAELAAEAGALEAAERQLRAVGQHQVDVDHPRFELVGDPLPLL